MKHDIFISYSRKDKEEVSNIVKELESQGLSCWIDLQGIETGAQFEDVIINAIDNCKVVVFMMSENSMLSDWTRQEINYVIDTKVKLAPVLLQNQVIPQKGFWRWKLSGINCVDYYNEDQKQKFFHDLKDWCGIKSQANESDEKSAKNPLSNPKRENDRDGDSDIESNGINYGDIEESKKASINKRNIYIAITILAIFASLFFVLNDCSNNGNNQKENRITALEDSIIPDAPKQAWPIIDYLRILPANFVDSVGSSLCAFSEKTGKSIEIVIIDDLKGFSISHYAQALGNKWGLGQKDKNNGVIVLIKPKIGKSKGEIFIATGTGIQDSFTDEECQRIVELMTEDFRKNNNYENAVSIAIDEITKKLGASQN